MRSAPTEDGALAERATRGFARVYGHQPTGVWAAPGRANLIGEHTDYNGGLVLPFALPHACAVAAAPCREPVLTVHTATVQASISQRLDQLAPGRTTGWARYPAGVAWALREAGHQLPGAQLYIDSEVPTGAGLSSSAALECATALALTALAGIQLDGSELALLAQRAENQYVGMPCGVMDQAASLLCRAGHALLLDCQDLSWTQIELDLAADGLSLVVIDTRTVHALTDGAYAERRSRCELGARTLGVRTLRELPVAGLAAVADRLDPVTARRVRHVVTEIDRVRQVAADTGAADPGRWSRVGAALTASHVSLREDYEVSCPELDHAVAAALEAGALGARMTGAGFGGNALALVETGRLAALSAAVAERCSRFELPAARAFAVRPAAGARRLR